MSESEKTVKDPAAVALGRKGGLRRAKTLTPKQLSEIGRRGAAKRWKTKQR